MAEFNWKPDFVFEETPKFQTIVSTFENGSEQRRARWGTARREWKLQFVNKTKTEFESIRNFFIAKKGALTAFTWENINDSVEYSVRFVEDSVNFKMKSTGVYDFEFSFIEVK